MDKREDTSLTLRLAKGDISALEELYLRFAPKVRAFAEAYLGKEAAKDLTHDIFLKIWNSRAHILSGTIIRNLDGYIFTVSKNAVLDRIKHLRVERSFVSDAIDGSREHFSSQIETAIDSRAALSGVNERLAALPEHQQRIFSMHRDEGLTYAQIAARTGLSERTVQYHISAVLRKIRPGS